MGDRDDPIVRNLTELAGCRQRPYEGVWTPEMNLSGEPISDADGAALVLDAEEDCDVIALRPGG